MSWRSDGVSEEEAKFYANRENTADRKWREVTAYEDGCYERCYQCEFWDDDMSGCSAGENILNCTIVG